MANQLLSLKSALAAPRIVGRHSTAARSSRRLSNICLAGPPFGSGVGTAAAVDGSSSVADLTALVSKQLESTGRGMTSAIDTYGDQLKVSIENTTLDSVLSQAGSAAQSAQQQIAAPFDVFFGDWVLNGLFFAVLAVSAYSLVGVAPRQ